MRPALLGIIAAAILLVWDGPPAVAEQAATGTPADEGVDLTAQASAMPNDRPDAEPDVGNVTGCQHRPAFMHRLAIPENARVSTSTRGLLGFSILMRDPQTDRIRPLVHDTWKSAGNLGQFTYDKHGNIYLVPVPLTSLESNPPQDQNKVYVIDAATGRMRELIDLPAPRPIGTANPFGTVGLAYDCETHSLYVSSLAGSGPTDELGTIFRISLADTRIASRLDGVDALGIAVFKGSSGKRLYLGSARRPEVRSVALNAEGDFAGEPRLEFDLGTEGLPGNYRAQKIRFTERAQMQLKALPFAYSLRLIGAEDIAMLNLHYLSDDRWEGGQGEGKR
jgi:hypothetical protein